VYEKICEAALAVGSTLNQFLVQAALEKANEVLERERVISLSAKEARSVFDLIENPPEPNDRLKKAMHHREDRLCRK